MRIYTGFPQKIGKRDDQSGNVDQTTAFAAVTKAVNFRDSKDSLAFFSTRKSSHTGIRNGDTEEKI